MKVLILLPKEISWWHGFLPALYNWKNGYLPQSTLLPTHLNACPGSFSF